MIWNRLKKELKADVEQKTNSMKKEVSEKKKTLSEKVTVKTCVVSSVVTGAVVAAMVMLHDQHRIMELEGDARKQATELAKAALTMVIDAYNQGMADGISGGS